MAIELVTGHAGEGHVSSADAGRYNAGVCGVGKYVLNTGQKFAYSIESANLIRIGTGDAVNQGRHISIRQNTYEDANILNGTQGKTRIDVITLRYSKVTTQVEGEPVTVEVATVEVIKGTEVPVGTAPEVPAVISGNIFDGATTDDMPLYHVLIADTSVTSVTAVFTVLDPLDAMWAVIDEYDSSIGGLANKIGDVEMGTTAPTLTGAIKELLTKLGSTAMGTTATTVTAAIKELVNKIGSTAMGTTATTVTGAIKELKTAISGLQSLINGSTFRIYEKAWDNISIGADWYYDRSGFNVTMSGYRALAITGFGVYPASSGGVYANWCLFQKCVLWRNTTSDFLDFYVWNQNKSATAKVKIRVWVLYVKTGLI